MRDSFGKQLVIDTPVFVDQDVPYPFHASQQVLLPGKTEAEPGDEQATDVHGGFDM